jgi:hypothetical protein
VHHLSKLLAVAAAISACALPRNTAARSQPLPATTPIEVEVQVGAVSCAPGNPGFDDALRSTIGQAHLDLAHAGKAGTAAGAIQNQFCLASMRPDVPPLRITVRLHSAGSISYYYGGGVPQNAIREAEHWTIEVLSPWCLLRWAPATASRYSLWIRSDSPDYCSSAGRVVAILLLETLHRQRGVLDLDQQLALGPGISRDPEYSDDTAALGIEEGRRALGWIGREAAVFVVALGAFLGGRTVVRSLRSR